MNCAYCGIALPDGALFCGECGRSVPQKPAAHDAAVPGREALHCPQCGYSMSAADIFCGECGAVSPSVSEIFVKPPEAEPPAPAIVSAVPPALAFDEDIESTRIVQHPRNGERFVLQFSTGESVTVYGSGLIGRNPHAEPGEAFDQLVRIQDATRSVSKTHLEFGQELGSFWVKDRFSGNGTTVREPDRETVRCRPGRRRRLARGSRVDIGEQFFVVS